MPQPTSPDTKPNLPQPAIEKEKAPEEAPGYYADEDDVAAPGVGSPGAGAATPARGRDPNSPPEEESK